MLSENQIEQLDQFCIRKGVKYYDLRQEIIDHLAESIEAIIQENPKLGFEAALQRVYKGFGIFGFGKIVREREEASRKQLKKLNNQYFKSYFTLPKVVFTAGLFLLLSIPYLLFPIGFEAIYTLSIGIVFLGAFTVFFISYKRYKQPAKKLLALNWIDNFGWIIVMFQFPNQILKLAFFKEDLILKESSLWLSVLITGLTVMGVITFMAKLHARKQIYQKAKQDYPLAFVKQR